MFLSFNLNFRTLLIINTVQYFKNGQFNKNCKKRYEFYIKVYVSILIYIM